MKLFHATRHTKYVERRLVQFSVQDRRKVSAWFRHIRASAAYPVSDEEWDICLTIAQSRRPVYQDYVAQSALSDETTVEKWTHHYRQTLLMYELGSLLLPSERDSAVSVCRYVSEETTAPSLRGLAQGTPYWSFLFAEYALSHWSLDDALKRIVRAVNMRTPLSGQQFVTLCHEYESIQHLPDSWVRDILGLEEAPVMYDCIRMPLYPGDVVFDFGDSDNMVSTAGPPQYHIRPRVIGEFSDRLIHCYNILFHTRLTTCSGRCEERKPPAVIKAVDAQINHAFTRQLLRSLR